MKIKWITICALLISMMMAITTVADTKYVNSREGLNVRDKPGTNGNILSVVPFGTAVQVLNDEDYGGWYLINFKYAEAYIYAAYTQDKSPFSEMSHRGIWRITAYADTGSPCANGNYPVRGYSAICNSLPLGAEVYISGVGFRIVEDRGPESMGDKWIDTYMGDVDECIQWVDQYRDVYVVEE